MLFFITRIFRGINARLITTDNLFLEKIYKACFALSIVLYRRFRFASVKHPVVVIDNYDQTIKMKIDRTRSMGAAIFWTGFHEFREFIFLHHFLKPNMVFVDVGANQGEYALFAAKRLSNGTVVAFEPLPSILSHLYENIKLNGFDNIIVFEKGVSDKQQSLVIHELDGNNEGMATVFPGDRVVGKSFEIQLERIDDIFSQTGLTRLDFMKFDIEGSELSALKGSVAVINKFRPVIMVEVSVKTYEAAGYKIQDVLEFFDQLGYDYFSIGKGGKLVPCKQLPVFANIIFKPR